MAKTIIFCADGIWSGSRSDDEGDCGADVTNVLKLFRRLSGFTPDPLTAPEQEKTLINPDGLVIQVAKYIRGVGDVANPFARLFGGAFGTGLVERIVRGYTYISRNYAPGDRIVLVGFSRGATTVRTLAGMIGSMGLLVPSLCADPRIAYHSGVETWIAYRQDRLTGPGAPQPLAKVIRTLFAKGLPGPHTVSRLPIDSIDSIAVWETVGILGVPDYPEASDLDLFRFDDAKLGAKVKVGFHAVSADDRCALFPPSLWEADPHVVQGLFAGDHRDVGGGHPIAGGHSGLSDIALGWMIDRLSERTVAFDPAPADFAPAARGPGHHTEGTARVWTAMKPPPPHPALLDRWNKPVAPDGSLYAPAHLDGSVIGPEGAPLANVGVVIT